MRKKSYHRRRFLIYLGAGVGVVGCSRESPRPVTVERQKPPVTSSPPPDRNPAVLGNQSEKQLAYCIELRRDGQLQRVKEGFPFHSGDRFRLIFRPAFS